jgi:acyl-CoA hydrolase
MRTVMSLHRTDTALRCACYYHCTGVVTTRAHVHYVVTEYGMAYLFGRSLSERAQALIAIAHPDDRAYLQVRYTITQTQHTSACCT